MLSRRHIRLKVMQALYMYCSGREDLKHLEKALDRSISKMYELYLYLLLFLKELTNHTAQYEEQLKLRYIQNEREQKARRFSENPILKILNENEEFQKALDTHKIHWHSEDDLLRKVFLDLKNQEIYNDCLRSSTINPVLEQEVLIFVLKHYTSNFPLFEHHLEELFFNWHDDKKIILQMAIKTVQSIAAEPGQNFLMPLSENEEENREFGRELLRHTIEQDEKLTEIVNGRITKWEPHLVALLDIIILKMAIAEYLNFPSIPSKVTINEYIELAKTYSTPQSKKFVNAVLDAVFKNMKKEGTVLKN